MEDYDSNTRNEISNIMCNPNITEIDRKKLKIKKEAEFFEFSQKHKMDINELNAELDKFILPESIDTPTARPIHAKH